MGLLDILTQLGQATAERARAKEFGADYRQRWQESADKHTLAETQNALSSANLRAKALQDETLQGMAKFLHPDLSPGEGLARIEADKYKLEREGTESEIGLRKAQAEYHLARPDMEAAKLDLQRQLGEARTETDRQRVAAQMAAIDARIANANAARAERDAKEPGSYTWMMGPDNKMHYVNAKSKKEFTFEGGEVPKQPPTAEMRGREAAMGRTAPILDQIEGLTLGPNGINLGTEGVLGRLGGKVKEAKGYFNLDNQVAEYSSLIQGFIPMVARAVGHTGVLTQQDVDSVRKLFPNPGDSEDIARSKINQVRDIMSGKSRFALPSQIGQPTGIGQQPTKPRFQILKVE